MICQERLRKLTCKRGMMVIVQRIMMTRTQDTGFIWLRRTDVHRVARSEPDGLSRTQSWNAREGLETAWIGMRRLEVRHAWNLTNT